MDKPSRSAERSASAFQEASVADAYRFRPPYPPDVFDVLAKLLPPGARRVLDAGCGTGAIARHLPALGVEVDAVDISDAMIMRGRQLPNGDDPAIHWHVSPIESVELTESYDLITAGESLHWMDWQKVLPRFARLLSPDGSLVILGLSNTAVPWNDRLLEIIREYSTAEGYREFDIGAELAALGLFTEQGRITTEPWTFVQSIDDYIESFHGRASFSRERMWPADSRAFDIAVRGLVSRYTSNIVELPVVAKIVWGQPAEVRSEK
jgi:SAM-dependent methyltransferase